MSTLLELDPRDFAAGLPAEACTVRHRLAEHELLTAEAVAELADRLPTASVEHNSGQIAAVLPGGAAPRVDSSPGEVARGIATNGCWMVLKNIEQDASYRDLLNAALDEVASLLPGVAVEMIQREGFIFLSAPESVTPAHIDPEHNFLLQVRGTKTMHVGSFPDPGAEQAELERAHSGGHRNMPYMPVGARAFELGPGDGVYVPVHAPHWVRNGPTVSVSFSITWRTPQTLRAERVYAWNARLRSRGISPRPPGEHVGRDRAKETATRVVEGLSRRLRRS